MIFNYTITNTGNATLTQIDIGASLLAGGTSANPAFTCTPTPVDMTVASLAPNASIVCLTTYTATQADLNDDKNLVAELAPVAKGPAGVRDVNTAQSTATVDADQQPAWTVEIDRQPNSEFANAGGKTRSWTDGIM